jgi:DNA-binding transcriptional LysR family regulator
MIHDVELRHFRYFIALAEDLSFTRAARRLNIAQPALSQQIRQLEQRLGTMLLVRTPRVALTPAGVAFVAAARRALAHVHQAADTARRVGAGTRAVLHVGLASSAALTAIPVVVERFTTAHPDVEIRLREMHSAEQLEALRSGALDVAILREAVTDTMLSTHELVREPFVLLAPAGHRLARARAIHLARCADEPFVLFARRTAPTLYDQITSMCGEAGFAPRVVHEAQEWHTISALVAAGLGISIAPRSVGALGISGTSVRRLPAAADRAVLFICHPGESAPEPIRRFVAFARRHVRSENAPRKNRRHG